MNTHIIHTIHKCTGVLPPKVSNSHNVLINHTSFLSPISKELDYGTKKGCNIVYFNICSCVSSEQWATKSDSGCMQRHLSDAGNMTRFTKFRSIHLWTSYAPCDAECVTRRICMRHSQNAWIVSIGQWLGRNKTTRTTIINNQGEIVLTSRQIVSVSSVCGPFPFEYLPFHSMVRLLSVQPK